MTELVALCLAVIALGLGTMAVAVWDVFRRALAAQVRRSELSVEHAAAVHRGQDVAALVERVAELEREVTLRLDRHEVVDAKLREDVASVIAGVNIRQIRAR